MTSSKASIKRPRAVVRTWGSLKDTSASGMQRYWDLKFFGGASGHACIALELPMSQLEKVKRYCDSKKHIPYNLKTDLRTGEKYIEVYFSWYGVQAEDVGYMDNYLTYATSPAADREINLKATDGRDDESLDCAELTDLYVSGPLGYRKIKGVPVARSFGEIKDDALLQEYINLSVQSKILENVSNDLDNLIKKFDTTEMKDGDKKLISPAKKSHAIRLLKGKLPADFNKKKVFAKDEIDKIITIARRSKEEVDNQFEEVSKNLQEVKEKIQIEHAKVHGVKKIDTNHQLSKIKYYCLANMPSIPGLDSIKYDAEMELRKLEAQEQYAQAVERLTEHEIESHLVIGQKENGCVHLPIGDNGLDGEAMLKEMYELAHNCKFHWKYLNCSTATARILAAGTRKSADKSIAEQKAWGFFGTPQKVYNAAKFIEKSLSEGNSIADRLAASDLLFVNRLIGKVIDTYIKAMKKDEEQDVANGKTAKESHRTVTKNKVFAIVKCLPLVPLIGGLFVLKHLLRPTVFIKDCASLLRWSFSTTRTDLKIAALVVLVPAIIVHAIPALIETGIKTALYGPAIGLRGLKKLSRRILQFIGLIDGSDTASITTVRDTKDDYQAAVLFDEKISQSKTQALDDSKDASQVRLTTSVLRNHCKKMNSTNESDFIQEWLINDKKTHHIAQWVQCVGKESHDKILSNESPGTPSVKAK